VGVGVGVECGWECVVVADAGSWCAGGTSVLIGQLVDVADAEETARARTVCVSRRLLGPSFTFGCVWHWNVVSLHERRGVDGTNEGKGCENASERIRARTWRIVRGYEPCMRV
jgi:hypothetical protein